MAPQLEEPEVKYDPEKNEINIELTGKSGTKGRSVVPSLHSERSKQQKLLPLKREGNLDYSVIDEGGRRVKLQLQEQGYFFAEVTPVCTVTPPTPNNCAERQRRDLPRTESSHPQ